MEDIEEGTAEAMDDQKKKKSRIKNKNRIVRALIPCEGFDNRVVKNV